VLQKSKTLRKERRNRINQRAKQRSQSQRQPRMKKDRKIANIHIHKQDLYHRTQKNKRKKKKPLKKLIITFKTLQKINGTANPKSPKLKPMATQPL
jgi:hypothetical protein